MHRCSWLIFAALLHFPTAGCGGKNQPTESETHWNTNSSEPDVPNAGSGVSKNDAFADVPLPKIEETSTDTIGSAPPSIPTGEAPIAIAYLSPKEGTQRVRSLVLRERYLGPERAQRTDTEYQVLETILKEADGVIQKIEVEVHIAKESIFFNEEQASSMPLLQGIYLVELGAPRLVVTHKTGRSVGNREVEALSFLVGGLNKDHQVVTALSALQLRPGESRQLSEEELATMPGSDSSNVPFFAHLEAADDTTATFSIHAVGKNIGRFQSIGLMQRLKIQRSSGTILHSHSERISVEDADRSEHITSKRELTY